MNELLSISDKNYYIRHYRLIQDIYIVKANRKESCQIPGRDDVYACTKDIRKDNLSDGNRCGHLNG